MYRKITVTIAPSFRYKAVKRQKLAASEIDRQILQRALEILSDEQKNSWSLFCALFRASVDVNSTYLHNKPAIKSVPS